MGWDLRNRACGLAGSRGETALYTYLSRVCDFVLNGGALRSKHLGGDGARADHVRQSPGGR